MRNTARPDAFVQGLFVSLGRLEGYLRWRLREQPFAEPTPADPRRAG